MGLTEVKRRFLVFFLFVLILLTILLLASYFTPGWWIIKYVQSERLKDKVTIGLHRACHKDYVKQKDSCKKHDQKDSGITGLNAIRGLLLSAIVLCFIVTVIAIVLTLNQTIKRLLWMIGVVKILTWLISGLLSICIGLSLTDRTNPKPPKWIDQNISGSTSIEYGWPYMTTCIGVIVALTLVIIVTCLLGFTLKYHSKYSNLNVVSATTPSTKVVEHFDWDVNFAEFDAKKGRYFGRAISDESKFNKNARDKIQFTYEKRGLSIQEHHQMEMHGRRNLASGIGKQSYYQPQSSANTTEINYADPKFRQSGGVINTIEASDSGVHSNEASSNNNPPSMIYRYNSCAGPAAWRTVTNVDAWKPSTYLNEKRTRQPTFINLLTNANQSFQHHQTAIVNEDQTNQSNRLHLQTSYKETQPLVSQLSQQGEVYIDNNYEQRRARKNIIVQGVATERNIFNVAYKNHGFPQPDYS
ncbi:uncharacterized protein LOC130642048 [Hydractinia symbiolongicarpus]|uniref:uncharacterized protein LOC130642048 n=1 Tax=Hydractinia symbiolongicarpus TaxID=13093 RepID=UPI00254C83AD|nr:uncharacterized protein LOC130642048 [Hydractinia symbiolongicarpus]